MMAILSRLQKLLTHRGRVMQICISKINIIISDNGLSAGQLQAIIWTNAAMLLIGWNLRNKPQWSPNWNSYIFMEENAFEYVV